MDELWGRGHLLQSKLMSRLPTLREPHQVLKLRFPSSATGLAACHVIKAKCAACLVEAYLNTAQRKCVFLGFVILRSVTRDLNCRLHNWIRDDFIERNLKGLVTHLQHELPTQNMIPLAYVGGYAKAEGFKVRSSFTDYFNGAYYSNKIKALPAARCVIDCSRGSAPSRAAKTTQRARKTPPLVYREPVVSSVTEHGARSAKSPVAELGKRSLTVIPSNRLDLPIYPFTPISLNLWLVT
ncbi:hypothetical protein J6590_064219 [Homalodisca vitripennis]|nr:hypothetical protein J6590_064219 [Homalodisca vitripennis]